MPAIMDWMIKKGGSLISESGSLRLRMQRHTLYLQVKEPSSIFPLTSAISMSGTSPLPSSDHRILMAKASFLKIFLAFSFEKCNFVAKIFIERCILQKTLYDKKCFLYKTQRDKNCSLMKTINNK